MTGRNLPTKRKSPSGRTSFSLALSTASSEMQMRVPKYLFRPSRREVAFTTSPSAAYFIRRDAPILPTSASPEWMPRRV